ncbi:MAG: hypothetical protein V5A23_06520 [Halobacteriales archaeon]
MEEAPGGTPVGVDDPYDHVEVCDHLTDDGRCRFAFERMEHDPAFARRRRADEFACPVVAPEASEGDRIESGDGDPDDWAWADCPHFRSRAGDRECVRCGLGERRMAHDDERPLLEEHHLSYASGGEELAHEITVYLCRWCHAKVHNSWARLDDDASPDPEALAKAEGRRSRELDEATFRTAGERYGADGRDGGGT